MRAKRLLFVLAALLVFAFAKADNSNDIKKKINSIKKNSQYLYAEATAPTEDEAYDIAEEMLYEEVNEWAATKKKLQNSVNIAINNKQSLWTTISLPRGNMFRSFIYVKKSDILPVENSDIINNTNIQPSEVTALQSSIEKILPKTVETLAECTEYSDFVSKVKQFKTEGKLRSYARYAQLDNPEACYLAIYNKDGKIVAILSPGNERHNINTGNPDSVANYSGCGAIGFVLDE